MGTGRPCATLEVLRRQLAEQRHAPSRTRLPNREFAKELVEHMPKVGSRVVVEAIVDDGHVRIEPGQDGGDLLALEHANRGAHQPCAVWQSQRSQLHADCLRERVDVGTVAGRRVSRVTRAERRRGHDARPKQGADGRLAHLRHDRIAVQPQRPVWQ